MCRVSMYGLTRGQSHMEKQVHLRVRIFHNYIIRTVDLKYSSFNMTFHYILFFSGTTPLSAQQPAQTKPATLAENDVEPESPKSSMAKPIPVDEQVPQFEIIPPKEEVDFEEMKSQMEQHQLKQSKSSGKLSSSQHVQQQQSQQVQQNQQVQQQQSQHIQQQQTQQVQKTQHVEQSQQVQQTQQIQQTQQVQQTQQIQQNQQSISAANQGKYN